MPAVLCHEIVRVGFVGQAEELYVANVAGQAGRNIHLTRVENGSCRQIENESKNLVIGPTVHFTDVGQEQNGEQFPRGRRWKERVEIVRQDTHRRRGPTVIWDEGRRG
jgi:hypothetical protein